MDVHQGGRGGGHRVQLPDALRHRVVLLQLPSEPVRRRRVEGKRRDGDRRERHLDRLPALVDGGVLGRSDHGLVRGAEVMREVRRNNARRRRSTMIAEN